MAIDSWSLVRVYGTWVTHAGVKLAGKYKVTISARLTNSADDLIIPAGIFAQGDLVVAEGVPSLSLMVPATDDPDIQQDGWLVTVEVSFSDAQLTERYVIEVPLADRPIPDGGTGAGVNLRTIALSTQMPPQAAMYGVGRPLGLALLSEDGLAVLDADGNPITGGGGGGSSAWGDITGKPAVIAAGATQAEARTAIDAAPSSHSHEAVQIADSTSVGRQVLTAASAAEARTAIDAQAAGAYLTSVPDATTSTKGAVELATTTEATAGTDTVRAVTPAGLKAAVDALVSGAPGALDTLSELAAALGNDASFATTITNALAARVRADTASQGLDSVQQSNARANIGALPIMPAANVGADYSIPYVSAAALGDRPTLPSGAVLRIWGGTVADTDPAWMVDGDYRDIPVAG